MCDAASSAATYTESMAVGAIEMDLVDVNVAAAMETSCRFG